MKQIVSISLLAMVVVLISSCASIVSKTSYPVSFNSVPVGATLTIQDRNGLVIFDGTTPATVDLESSAGFFRKAIYQVTFSKMGYESKTIPLRATIDGWYAGNILFGGLIGFLFVDPATGAMFKIEEKYIDEKLIPMEVNGRQGFKIYDINDIPSSWKQHLVKIEE